MRPRKSLVDIDLPGLVRSRFPARIYRHARTFLQSVNRVHSHIIELLDQSTWPAHLDRVYFLDATQPKMHPHIALRDVASPTANLVYHYPLADFHRYAGPDSVSIGEIGRASCRERGEVAVLAERAQHIR